MLTLSMENDIIVKITQECLRIMKHRLFALVMICAVLMSLCGCDKYIKGEIYDTDVYGTYISETFLDNITEPFEKKRLILSSDNTYEYDIYQNLDGEAQEESVFGDIIEVSSINNDIISIKIDGYELKNKYVFGTQHIKKIFYKYKNLLGDYIQFETSQIKCRSSFSIPLDNSGEYYLRFTEDGMCKYDSAPDEEQYYYKYKVKSDIIFIDYGYGYGAAYYIVDGGVFSGNSFSKSE